jgi:DNA-binding LacI/PurR family transcriptional regulator
VPLTTVGWSRRDMGRHAAELLLSGLGGPDEITPRRGRPQRIIVPPHLIVRESSAAS